MFYLLFTKLRFVHAKLFSIKYICSRRTRDKNTPIATHFTSWGLWKTFSVFMLEGNYICVPELTLIAIFKMPGPSNSQTNHGKIPK